MSEKRRLYQMLIAGLAVMGVLSIIAVCFLKYMPTSKLMSSEVYFGSLGENEAVIVVDDHIAQEHALILEGSVYLDYSVIQSQLNSRFYWDASIGSILYTTVDATLEIPANSTTYYSDGEAYDAGYEIIKTTSSGMYMSANFLQQFSDLTISSYEAPSRVVIRFGSTPYMVANVKKNTAVRFLGGIKSEIITKVVEDSNVYVLEQMNKWSRVCTEDGYIGYVKNSALKKVTTKISDTYYTEPESTGIALESKVNLTWHQIDYQEANANLVDDLTGVTGINVISPTWYFLSDNSGEMISFADKKYVKKAHKRGLQVWALISNFSPDISTTTILSSKEARNKIQNELVAQAQEYGFDGINVDLEGIAQEAGYSYLQFMRELSVLCKKYQLCLSVDVPVPYDFNAYYNYAELGRVCDYVIMMGYDEHYYGSEEAGSVASLGFEERGLGKMLEDVPAHKIISGIPFYSRVWYTTVAENGETSVTSNTVTMQEAQDLLADLQITSVYDEASGQNYASWTDEEGRICEIWLEDAMSIQKRVELASNYAVGGIAQWVLGHETNEVWEIIKEGLAL